MARYAREELGYTGPLATETQSRSTWENIQNAIPLIEAADHIKIVSNFWHTPEGPALPETAPSRPGPTTDNSKKPPAQAAQARKLITARRQPTRRARPAMPS